MPARDAIHDAVRNALVKDGWTITADPYTIDFAELVVYADLGADRSLSARRGDERLVVEAKTFLGRSVVYDFEHAIGQYELYRLLLRGLDSEARLYLAVSEDVYETIFQRKGIAFVTEELRIRLLVIDCEQEEIVRWIR